MIKEIREELDQLGEESYKQFNQKLIPGTDHVIGVRMPALRKLAKGIAKTDSKQYLEEAQTEIDERSAHEEIMLYGLVLGYAKMSIEQRMQALDMFVPKIHNWAVCDSCCMGYKFMEKEQEVWFSYLRKYQNSSREFEVRFFIVSLLAHYINEAYIEQVLEILNHTSHEGYYVKWQWHGLYQSVMSNFRFRQRDCCWQMRWMILHIIKRSRKSGNPIG